MAKAKKPADYQTQLVNLQAAQLAAQVANNAAQQEFLRMRFTQLEQPQFAFMSEMEKERLSFQQAQQAFQEAFQTASLTGQYNGAPTVAEQQRLIENSLNQGALTGYFNGEQTAAERNAAFQRAFAEAGITGTYNGEQTAAERAAVFQRALQEAGLTGIYNGQQTTDWQAQQAGLTGYFGGNPTLARQQMEGSQGLDLLKLRASLRGPRDAFAFARSIEATGSGLRGMLAGAAGTAPFQAYSGLQAPLQRANIAGLAPDVFGPGYGAPVPQYNPFAGYPNYQPVAGSSPQPGPGVGAWPYAATPEGNVQGQYLGAPAYTPPALAAQAAAATQNAAAPVSHDYEGQQAASNLYNYQPTGDGSYYTYPPGMTAPQDAYQLSSSVPMTSSELDKLSAGLPNPNQIDTNWWNQAPQYNKDVLLGAYEDAGWDANYVEQLRQQAMPKYTSPTVGAFL